MYVIVSQFTYLIYVANFRHEQRKPMEVSKKYIEFNY